MTLRDRFEQWFINDEEDEHYEGMVEQVAIAHEKITDEFAIGFAEFCFMNSLSKYPNNNYKELLEIYKKQKGKTI